MIYTSVMHKSRTRIVPVNKINNQTVVILHGRMNDEGKYEKTGPHCIVKYAPSPPSVVVRTFIAPTEPSARNYWLEPVARR